jgi:hypothetical protein
MRSAFMSGIREAEERRKLRVILISPCAQASARGPVVVRPRVGRELLFALGVCVSVGAAPGSGGSYTSGPVRRRVDPRSEAESIPVVRTRRLSTVVV